MSYRNDHDAALARVDALEHENAQLAAENLTLRGGGTTEPRPTVNKHGLVLAMIAAATAGTVIAVFASGDTSPPRPHFELPAPSPEPALHMTRVMDLDKCTLAINEHPGYADDKATDPHGSHQALDGVMRSTGCRDEIRWTLDTAVLSTEQRHALVTWADAEDRLANSVSMIGEYYAHDPYDLDGYSTAPQLCTEYNRALEIRNHALDDWRSVAK